MALTCLLRKVERGIYKTHVGRCRENMEQRVLRWCVWDIEAKSMGGQLKTRYKGSYVFDFVRSRGWRDLRAMKVAGELCEIQMKGLKMFST